MSVLSLTFCDWYPYPANWDNVTRDCSKIFTLLCFILCYCNILPSNNYREGHVKLHCCATRQLVDNSLHQPLTDIHYLSINCLEINKSIIVNNCGEVVPGT